MVITPPNSSFCLLFPIGCDIGWSKNGPNTSCYPQWSIRQNWCTCCSVWPREPQCDHFPHICEQWAPLTSSRSNQPSAEPTVRKRTNKITHRQHPLKSSNNTSFLFHIQRKRPHLLGSVTSAREPAAQLAVIKSSAVRVCYSFVRHRLCFPWARTCLWASFLDMNNGDEMKQSYA